MKKPKSNNPWKIIRKPTAPPSKTFGGTAKQNNKRDRKRVKQDIKREV